MNRLSDLLHPWIDSNTNGYRSEANSNTFGFLDSRDTFKLLLRLFNNTFLSLPIIKCHRLRQNFKNSEEVSDNHQGIFDPNGYNACNIDWSQASVSRSYVYNSLTSSNQTSLLSSLAEQNATSLSTQQARLISTLLNQLTDNNRANSLISEGVDQDICSSQRHIFDDYFADNLFKSTYLSGSWILTFLGIVINAFIILIILMSTKQKSHSLLRNSNTGQNNLLLFQLSITGIFLSGYTLVDNLANNNISMSTLLYKNLKHDSQTMGWAEVEPCKLTSILPPPAPFVEHEFKSQSLSHLLEKISKPVQSNDRNGKLRIAQVDKNFQEKTLFRNQSSISLILGFGNTHGTPTGLWYLRRQTELIFHPDFIRSNSTLLLSSEEDLGEHLLEEISISTKYCPKVDALYGNDIPVKKNTDGSFEEFQVEPINESSFLGQGYLSACSVISMLMNFVGSIYVWTITALAYDRYCAIAHPLQYLRPINTLKSRTYFISLWLISLAFNLILPVTFERFKPHRDLSSDQHNHVDPTSFMRAVQTMSGSLNTGSGLQIELGSLKENCGLDEVHPISLDSGKLGTEEESTSAIGTQWAPIAPILVELSRKVQPSYTLSHLDVTSTNSISQEQANDPEGFFLDPEAGGSQAGRVKYKAEKQTERIYVGLIMVYCLFSFALIVSIPLLIITVCNINIYRIVKVHERRLSVNSGSNAPTSGFGSTSAIQGQTHSQRHSYWYHHQHPHHHRSNPIQQLHSGEHSQCRARKENCFDERSEDGSLMSVILTKLFHGHNHKPNQSNSCSTSLPIPADESSQAFLQQSAESQGSNLEESNNNETHSHRNQDTSLVNRSKRLIAREDSFQILAKLQSNQDQHEQKNNLPLGSSESCNLLHAHDRLKGESDSNGGETTNQASNQQHHFSVVHRDQPKRKNSDHKIAFHLARKESFNSQLDERDCVSREIDYQSSSEMGSVNNSDSRTFEVGGIFNQLKMAGLSFAGVAIQDLTSGVHHQILNKSTSCSLGNLNVTPGLQNNRSHRNNYPFSESRCSIESAPTNNNQSFRRSYVHMNGFSRHHSYIQRCATKLLEHEETIPPPSTGTNQMCQGQTSRSSSFGTKSAIFNIVTWLTTCLLILTLPQYILIIISMFNQYESEQERKSFLYDPSNHHERLKKLQELLLQSESKLHLNRLDINRNDIPLWTSSSIWLSYVCRLLFLSIIPLNGWLYGIRSRSLRTSIRMILRRYISRRQASIEITQRQRSVSSTRLNEHFINNTNSLGVHLNSNEIGDSTSCIGFQNGTRIMQDSRSNNAIQQRSCPTYRINEKQMNCYDGSANTNILNYREESSSSLVNSYKDEEVNKVKSHDLTNIMIDRLQNTASETLPRKRRDMSACPSLDSSSKFFVTSAVDLNQPIPNVNPRDDYTYSAELASNSKSVEGVKKDLREKRLSSNSLTSKDKTNHNFGRCQLRRQNGFDLKSKLRRQNTRLSNKEVNLRKSASEFKFLITSADLDHRVVELGDLWFKSQDIEPDTQSELKLTDNWYQQLRQSLVKLMVNTKLAVGFSGSYKKECDIQQDPESQNSLVVSAESIFDGKEDLSLGYERGVRRTSSLKVCRPPKMKRHTNGTLVRSISDLSSTTNRNITVANMDGYRLSKRTRGVDCSCPLTQKSQSGHNAQLCLRLKHTNSRLDLSAAYLKPPNFLKLVLDPDGQAYAGGSALSPIKEYSSNHSYASSQSSLNNNCPNSTTAITIAEIS